MATASLFETPAPNFCGEGVCAATPAIEAATTARAITIFFISRTPRFDYTESPPGGDSLCLSMLPALSVLIELQALDSAIDAARKRLAEIPALEKSGTQQVAGATAVLDAAKKEAADSAAARKLV